MRFIDISILDTIVIIAYIVLLVLVGIYTSKNQNDSKISSNEDIFLSGRTLPWYKVGLSIFSTNVSPSMLVAYFGAAYASGMVLANFEWMAWIFLLLLSFLFIPHYLKNRISTMPEFLLKRFGHSAHGFFTYFSMFSSLVTWASFMLCIGGIVINQLIGIPVYLSAIFIVIIALSYSSKGGLTSIVHTGMIQSILLLVISISIFVLAFIKIGSIESLINGVPKDYWTIFRPMSDTTYPWHAILLGYPVIGIWFWCTEQSIVQRTLAAKSIRHGQLGAWLVAVLKIIMPFIFIVPGIMCLVLVQKGSLPALESPDHAYISMVFGLLPRGLIGLALATLLVSIINDVATGINSFSTIFAIDFYSKKIEKDIDPQKMKRIANRSSWIAGVVAILIAIFFSQSGKGLFELGQSLCTYLAPPVSTVFLLGLLWKGATSKAAELTLYLGTFFCLLIGLCQLIDFPNAHVWPHFMLLCFYMMVVLVLFMVIVSLFTQDKKIEQSVLMEKDVYTSLIQQDKPSSSQMVLLWALVAVIMFTLYFIFK